MIDDFSLEGIRKMKDNLIKLKSLFHTACETALEDEANDILKEANDNHVPVDYGTLRDSGEVTPVVWTDNDTVATITIKYTARHAEPVHENPSSKDPPTWEGKQIQWNNGRGPKFLEIPVRAAESGMAERIGRKVIPS